MIDKIQSLIQQNKVEQNLFKGSGNKSAVKSLQTALFELGFGEDLGWGGAADGSFGPATARAVVAFAERNKISGQSGSPVSKQVATQIVQKYQVLGDVRTFQSLVDQQGLTSLVKSSDRNPTAKVLQRLLNATAGTNLTVDGFFGSGTASAVKQFGSQVGIQTNGEKVDESLAKQIIAKIISSFGDDWATAKVGRYFELEPEAKNGLKQIKKIREKLRPERIKKDVTKKYRYEFESITDKVQGEDLEIDIEIVRKFGEDNKQIISFHYQEGEKEGRNGLSNVKHDRIVLHFTIGLASVDLRTLTKENYHVSTAFLLGRDGTIYQLFSPHQWSYHLGPDAIPNNHNSRSIGIEMCNFGPLKEGTGVNAGKLMDAYGTVYCGIEDTDAYIKLPKPYRSYEYYTTHSDAQYESLIVLLRYLTKEFPQIPRKFLDTNKTAEEQGNWDSIPRYRIFQGNEAENFRGICSHVNYRKPNEKFDVGPAFDWDRLIAGVTAPTFSPKKSGVKTKSIFGGPRKMSQAEFREEMRQMDYGEQDSSIYGEGGPETHDSIDLG